MAQKAPSRSDRAGMTARESDGHVPGRTKPPKGGSNPFSGTRDGSARTAAPWTPRNARTASRCPTGAAAATGYFSVRTGTPMHRSKIALKDWAYAIYLHSTSLKGVSSMRLHRELGITQKSGWHMAHRIREAF